MEEKFCLRWNDFQTTVSSSFGILRQEKDFFDVTLVSDDEIQIPAHKLVLSACSGFFKSILKTNVHSHPLLYLSGIDSRNLGYILDYIYQGEVNLYQSQLDSFLDSAQKLRIEGLQAKENECVAEPEQKETVMDENNLSDYGSHCQDNNSQTILKKIDEDHEDRSFAVSLETNGEDEVKAKIKELLSEDHKNRVYSCKICGRTGNDNRNMRKHIATHIEGLSYPCELCGKTFRSRDSYTNHKYRTHR